MLILLMLFKGILSVAALKELLQLSNLSLQIEPQQGHNCHMIRFFWDEEHQKP